MNILPPPPLEKSVRLETEGGWKGFEMAVEFGESFRSAIQEMNHAKIKKDLRTQNSTKKEQQERKTYENHHRWWSGRGCVVCGASAQVG
jgi:hypothetical protein